MKSLIFFAIKLRLLLVKKETLSIFIIMHINPRFCKPISIIKKKKIDIYIESKMQYILVAICIILVIIFRWSWRLMNWLWLQPRCLEKCLRELGFRGNSYKFLVGDMNEVVKMDEEAKSKPIKF